MVAKIRNATRDVDMNLRDLPFRRLFFFLALAKAGVAGASIGIAALGITDLTFMATAGQWWDSVRPDHVLNEFAVVGGILGVLARIVTATWA